MVAMRTALRGATEDVLAVAAAPNLANGAKTPAEAVRALDDEDFAAVVKLDVKGELDDPWRSALRDGATAERWYDALVTEKRLIEAQITQRAADLGQYQQECFENGPNGKNDYFRAKAEHDTWRHRAVWAKTHIETRVAEAKRLRNAHHAARHDADELKPLLRRFRSALKQIAHYSLVVDPEGLGDPEEIARFFQEVALEALGEPAKG